ncbi:MAG: MotA/TolQ/ExbB proton channel family protein, partial [Bacteroidota bacterium]
EALVATALGLLVAIPATMGYNYFVHQIQRMSSRIDVAVFDVIEELSSKPEDGREKENRG